MTWLGHLSAVLLFGTISLGIVSLKGMLDRVRAELWLRYMQKARTLELIDALERDLRLLGRGLEDRSAMLLGWGPDSLLFCADINGDGRSDSVLYRWMRGAESPSGRIERWVNGSLSGETGSGVEVFALEPLDERGRPVEELARIRMFRVRLRYRAPFPQAVVPLEWVSFVGAPNLSR